MKMQMSTKAVLFDLDDTLVIEKASAEEALLAACSIAHEKYGINPEKLSETVQQKARELSEDCPARAYCVSIGLGTREGLWARFEGDNPNLKILRNWAPAFRRRAWTEALAEFGTKDNHLAEQLSETFQTERRSRNIAYPDAEPVLKKLQERYKLAIVSNGPTDLQMEKLEGSGLAGYFDAVVIAGQIGIAKPDTRIFEAVLEKLELKAEQAIMVGNRLATDIGGAQQAGIKAIRLNRDKKEGDNIAKPDYEISNLNELYSILNNI
jgi:putative hydrolase of the HAD superfamily